MFGKPRVHLPEPALPPFDVNTASTEKKLEEAERLIRDINDLWASLPRTYKLWIDWDARPPRLTMTDRVFIERNVIIPR